MTSHSRRSAVIGTVASLGALALPHIARAAVQRLRIAHNNTVTSNVHAGAVEFAKACASLSSGSILVDVFPNAQLGNETQTMAAVVNGTLDAMVTNLGQVSAYVKDATLIELPYLFSSVQAARSAFDGSMCDRLGEQLKAQGIVVAGWGEVGIRHITANKPVRSPADVKGLKIRVQVSEPTIQTFKIMGAQAETMAFPQVPEALRTGRFDAQENPIAIVQANALNRVQSHISLTGHVYSPGPILFANDVFEDLSPGSREVVRKAGAIGAKAMRAFCDIADRDGLDLLRAAGMKVIDDIDRVAFRKAGEEASVQLAAIFGTEALDRVRKFSS